MAGRNDCDVLIAGGGNVGLALAAALQQQGFSAAVVEGRPPQAPATVPDVGLRVSALSIGSRRFLEHLKAWPASDRRGPTAYQNMQVESRDGRGCVNFSAHEQGLPALGWIVDNEHLRATLWQRCQQLGVSLHEGVQVTEVQSKSRSVSAQLDNGQSLRAQLLAAADGARSPIRQQLGFELEERPYEQQAIVAVVNTERANQGLAWQRYLASGPLAFLPISGGRSSIVWTLEAEQAQRLMAADDNQFMAELQAASVHQFGPITAIGQRAVFPLSLMLAKRYVHERVFLVGDAAHRIHPQAGQGLNIGLQDAAAMAELLTEQGEVPTQAVTLERLLRRYERWRRSDDELMVRGVDRIGQTLRGDSVAAQWAGIGLSLVDRLPPLKGLFLRHAAGTERGAPKWFRRPVK
ncbi:MAG: FAD-dependent monooxygenase [Xanthomonadales bacterium]|nr:FAD-dependent monooxygenase [Xanthomonadales bacterium]